MARAERGRLPVEGDAGRSAPPAFDRRADLDAARAHGGDVGVQIVALNGDEPQAAAALEKGEERAARTRAEILVAISHGHELQIVVVVQRERVVGAAARMIAARVDIEAEAAIRVDAGRQLRHADHQMIDPREHRRLSRS